MSRFVSCETLAKRLEVTERTVRRWMARAGVHPFKIWRRKLWNEEAALAAAARFKEKR